MWLRIVRIPERVKGIRMSSIMERDRLGLLAFSKKWDVKYGSISRMWERSWEHLITMFEYPDEFRKVTYTTNAIESLNSVIRKWIKYRRIFPQDTSAFKIVYLAVQQAAKRWTMPIRDWGPVMNRLLVGHGERFSHE